MVVIKNDQTVPVNEKQLMQDGQKVLDHLGYSDFDLGILLTDNKTMQEYNKKYRDKDKPTDILSFPFYPNLKPGQTIQAPSESEKNIGDIIISPEYVKKDLPRWNQPFDERMQVLLVHGICHLLGYEHIKDKDYEVMQKKENELLSLLKS